VADHLLQPPVNVLRLCCHPDGLAPRTVNLGEWAAHLRERLARQCEATADPVLVGLHDELKAMSLPAAPRRVTADMVVVPFQLRHGEAVLNLMSTTMVFGTPVDITLSELAVETFFPADDSTAVRLRTISDAASRGQQG